MSVVGFSGRIASGKSEISRCVATMLAVPRASFGDTVREEARERGLPDDRATLQDLGSDLIGEGWERFCDRLVEHLDWDRSQLLVVDGVRHRGAIDALRRIALPEPMALLFIDTPSSRRIGWQMEREVTEEAAGHADAHPNESEVPDVQRQADFVVLNGGSLEDAVSDSIAAIRRLALIE